MDYSFNVEVAKTYGVPEAVFLHNLYFWITKNEANGRHYYEDKEYPGVFRHWTYNSASALVTLFPFWSIDQIKRLIRKLRDNGLIHVGNYNKEPYDKTGWYAISEEVLAIYHGAKSPHPRCEIAPTRCEIAPPIPDSKPDSKHIYKDIVEYLNEKTGKSFSPTTKSTKEHIHARLEDGFELSDFKKVIDLKVHDWKDDPDMCEYLRPSTLFGTKFESYLNKGVSTQERRWKELE